MEVTDSVNDHRFRLHPPQTRSVFLELRLPDDKLRGRVGRFWKYQIHHVHIRERLSRGIKGIG